MSMGASVIREARLRAELTQGALARKLAVSQATIAQLESPKSNPTLDTLDRVLHATGHRLELTAVPTEANVDETLIAQQLRLTPAERLRGFEKTYRDVQRFAQAAERSRGGS